VNRTAKAQPADGSAQPPADPRRSQRIQIGLAIAAGVLLIGVLVWWLRVHGAPVGPSAEEAQLAAGRDRVEALVKAGKIEEAANALRDLLAAYPDAPDAVKLHAGLAGMLVTLHREDEAVEVMEKLARRRPDDPQIGQGLVAMYDRLGRYREAAAELERLTERFGQDAEAPMLLGSLRAGRLGDPAGGEKALREARRRDPRSPLVAGMLADVLYMEGETDEAMDLYREAAAAPGGRIKDRIALASLLGIRHGGEGRRAQPRLREAIRLLQDAIRLRQQQLNPRAGGPDETLLACHQKLAELHATLGERDQAIGHMQWAIRVTPPDDRNLSLRYMSLVRYGIEGNRPDVATEARRQIDRLWPRDAVLTCTLGQLYEEMGRPDQAVPLYLLAEQYDPKYTTPYRQLAELYLREGKLAEANEQIFAGLDVEPRNPMLQQTKDRVVEAIRRRAGLPDIGDLSTAPLGAPPRAEGPFPPP
jgi:tetratricopeptide (TPR) repeat protein